MIKLLNFLLLLSFFIIGCGKSDNQTSGNKTGKQTSSEENLQVSGDDKLITVQCSGMTCTGCENSVKAKVKKVKGVRDVIADYKTNTVKAAYDEKQTNAEEIKNAITDAGYDVVSVK
jgi:copper chaperone